MNENLTLIRDFKIDFEELVFNRSDINAFPSSFRINFNEFEEEINASFTESSEDQLQFQSEIFEINQENNKTVQKYSLDNTEVLFY